jgi:ferredoxin
VARKLEIAIDQDLCMGAESCVYTAPGTFKVDDGKTFIILPPGDDESTIVDAAIMCPMQAITVKDGETGADLRP